LGGAPNAVEQEQKILVFVFSWAWTSSPITASNPIDYPLLENLKKKVPKLSNLYDKRLLVKRFRNAASLVSACTERAKRWYPDID
jgi:hypothetical protein